MLYSYRRTIAVILVGRGKCSEFGVNVDSWGKPASRRFIQAWLTQKLRQTGQFTRYQVSSTCERLVPTPRIRVELAIVETGGQWLSFPLPGHAWEQPQITVFRRQALPPSQARGLASYRRGANSKGSFLALASHRSANGLSGKAGRCRWRLICKPPNHRVQWTPSARA